MAKKAEFAASKIYDPAKHQKEEEEKAQENAPEEKTKANGDTRPVGGRHQRQDKEDDAPSTSVAPALLWRVGSALSDGPVHPCASMILV